MVPYMLNSRSEEKIIRNTSRFWASFGIRIQEYVWNTVLALIFPSFDFHRGARKAA